MILFTVIACSACPSGSSHSRFLGTIETPIGQARIYCGGNYTRSCSKDAALVFPQCSDAYEAATKKLANVANSDDLKRQMRNIAGADAPAGRRWTGVSCGSRPPSP